MIPGEPGRRGILLAGPLMVDITKTVSHWPDQDTVAFVHSERFATGGTALNVGLDLAALDPTLPVSVVGAVGDDALADIVFEALAGSGIDAGAVRRVAGQPTSSTDAMCVIGTGRRTFFHRMGVNAVLEADAFAFARTNARIAVIGMPGIAPALDGKAEDSPGWRLLLGRAREAGCATALEVISLPPGRLGRLVPPCLKLVDLFVLNEIEAEAVTGIAVLRDGAIVVAEAERAAAMLFAMGVGRLVAIHAPCGAVAFARDGGRASGGSVALPEAMVAGSVGAGDAFSAGVFYGLHEGWELGRAVALGNAAASLSLLDLSASGGLRHWTEALAFAERHGVRQAPT